MNGEQNSEHSVRQYRLPHPATPNFLPFINYRMYRISVNREYIKQLTFHSVSDIFIGLLLNFGLITERQCCSFARFIKFNRLSALRHSIRNRY